MSETTETSPPGIVRIGHNEWISTIRDYVKAKADKRKADADARGYDTKVKSLRSKLYQAMGMAPAAALSMPDGRPSVILTVKHGAPSEGALTLRDGRKIPLSSLSFIVLDDESTFIPVSDVSTWYGGRAGSDDIEVTGDPT